MRLWYLLRRQLTVVVLVIAADDAKRSVVLPSLDFAVRQSLLKRRDPFGGDFRSFERHADKFAQSLEMLQAGVSYVRASKAVESSRVSMTP